MSLRQTLAEVAVGTSDGVARSSVVNLDNVQLLDRARLHRRVGRARPATMSAICRALATATGCPDTTGVS